MRGWIFASISQMAQTVLQLVQGPPGPSGSAAPEAAAIADDLASLQETWQEIQVVLRDAEEREVREHSVMLWLRELRYLSYDAQDLLESYQYEITAREVAEVQAQRAASASRKRKRSDGDGDDNSGGNGHDSGGEGGWDNHASNPLEDESFRRRLAEGVRRIRERYDEISRQKEDLQLREEDGEERFDEDREPLRSAGSQAASSNQVFGRDEDLAQLIQLLLHPVNCSPPPEHGDSSRAATVEHGHGDFVEVIAVLGMGGVGKTTLCQLAFEEAQVLHHFDVKGWVRAPENWDDEGHAIHTITNMAAESLGVDVWGSPDLATVQSLLQRAVEGKRFLLVVDDVWNEDPRLWQRFVRPLITSGCASGSKIVVTSRSTQAAEAAGAAGTKRVQGLSEHASRCLFWNCVVGGDGDPQGAVGPPMVDIGVRIVDKCRGLPLAIKALGRLLSRYTRRDSGGDEEIWRSVLENDLWDVTATHDGKCILGPLLLSYLHLPAPLRPCFRLCSLFPKSYPIDREHLVMLWSAHGLLREPEGGHEGDGADEELPPPYEGVGARYIEHLLSASFFQTPSFLSGPSEDRSFVAMHDLVHDLAQNLSGAECRGFTDDQPPIPSSVAEARHLSFFTSSPDTLVAAIRTPLSSSCSPADVASLVRTLLLSWVEDAARNLNGIGLGRLRVLSFERGDATELEPSCFTNMIHLRYLCLRRTRGLHQLPAPISSLYNLQMLDLSNSYDFKQLPDTIGNLRSLRQLNLSDTPLEALPKAICELSNLRRLKLLGTRIEELPERVGDMRALRYLDVGCTRIARLPDSVGGLGELRKLVLQRTGVRYLPETLCSLSNLRELDVGDCQELHRLPGGIGDLTNLQVLKLHSVPVAELPAGIGRLTKLRDLRTFAVGKDAGNQTAGMNKLRDLKHLAGELSIACIRNTVKDEEAKEARLWEKTGLERLTLHWGTKWELCTEFDFTEEEDEDAVNEDEFLRQEKVLEALEPPATLKELRIGKYGGRRLPTWLSQDQRRRALQQRRFEKLHMLNIYRCPNLTFMHPLPLASSLRQLEIEHCRSLRHLPVYNLSSLERLTVEECDVLDSLGFEEGRHLWLLPPPTSRPLNVAVDSGCPHCPNLKEVTVRHCPRLRVPPHSCLPPSLEQLFISNCPELKLFNLAEVPPRLKFISVDEAPQLINWCREHRLSELGHVPRIMLDGDAFFLSLPENEASHTLNQPAKTSYPFYIFPTV